MYWRIAVQFEPESPGNPDQGDLELDKGKSKKNPKNTILEDAFAAVRQRVGFNNIRKVVFEKVDK